MNKKNTHSIEHVKPNECNFYCQFTALRKLLKPYVFSTVRRLSPFYYFFITAFYFYFSVLNWSQNYNSPPFEDFNVITSIMEMANIFRQDMAKDEKILCVHRHRPSIFRSAYNNQSRTSVWQRLIHCLTLYTGSPIIEIEAHSRVNIDHLSLCRICFQLTFSF